MNKDNILDNLQEYTPQELAGHVINGVITLEEIRETGELPTKSLKAIEEIITQNSHAEDTDWDEACVSDTISAYQEYLSNYPSGKYADDARDRIADLIQEDNSHPEGEWDSVDKTNIDALRAFIQQKPDSPHVSDARTIINELINELRKKKSRGRGTRLVVNAIKEGYNSTRPDIRILELLKEYIKDELITSRDIATVIGEDNNIMAAEIVQNLCNEGIITYDDLENISNIDSIFIDKLMDYQSNDVPDLPSARLLESINDGCTEVYFWGIPSSGKTCALGAIMSAASNGTCVKAMRPDGSCQGAAYMMQLKDLFDPESISVLPPRTDVQDTYEMRFTLVDEESREHKLAFIDLSGELFTCMHLKASGLPLKKEQEDAINTLDNILVKNKTNNHKIHFFVVEYGAHEKRIDGMSQDSYLQAAISYIDEMNIFDKYTDGVYMIVTKADKANVPGIELGTHLANYIEKYYKGLYWGLVDLCEKKEINGGEVKRFPFSIGKVCFRRLCRYDKEWTISIIEEIKDRSYSERADRWGNFITKIRK